MTTEFTIGDQHHMHALGIASESPAETIERFERIQIDSLQERIVELGRQRDAAHLRNADLRRSREWWRGGCVAAVVLLIALVVSGMR